MFSIFSYSPVYNDFDFQRVNHYMGLSTEGANVAFSPKGIKNLWFWGPQKNFILLKACLQGLIEKF